MRGNATHVIVFLIGAVSCAAGLTLGSGERALVEWAVKMRLAVRSSVGTVIQIRPVLLYAGVFTQCGVLLLWAAGFGRSDDPR